MELRLGENQYTTIHLDGLEAVREEGSFQSAPKWVCSNNTIVKITPDEDGCSCRIEAARPIQHGTATVTVTDRDDSSVPPVIFNITITRKPTTNLGVVIEPATEIGKQEPPLPPGPVQKDVTTGVLNKNPEADGGKPFGEPEQPKS